MYPKCMFERANLSAFHMFDQFVLAWICQFPLPLGVWEGLRFVIVALPGLFSYLFFHGEIRKILTLFDLKKEKSHLELWDLHTYLA